MRAVAKGVRRTTSRFGARLEPFTHVDLQIYEGRSLDVITQAETVRPYGEPFAADYPRYTAGTAMLETAERLTPVEKEPALRQFLLLVGGLRTLGEVAHDPRMVLDAYPATVAGGRRIRAGARRMRPLRHAQRKRRCGQRRRRAWQSGQRARRRWSRTRRSWHCWHCWYCSRRVAGIRHRRGRPGVRFVPSARCGVARRADGRPDGRAAPRRLGVRRRERGQAPGRVQRLGGCLSAVAPGALDPFIATRGACVKDRARQPVPQPARPPVPATATARRPAHR